MGVCTYVYTLVRCKASNAHARVTVGCRVLMAHSTFSTKHQSDLIITIQFWMVMIIRSNGLIYTSLVDSVVGFTEPSLK
jgi:accessory gene regulator protein AgrB